MVRGAHKAPDFVGKNNPGQVPVIEDGDIVIADSNAILIYLATRYDLTASCCRAMASRWPGCNSGSR
jgi:glutathione S-transferase